MPCLSMVWQSQGCLQGGLTDSRDITGLLFLLENLYVPLQLRNCSISVHRVRQHTMNSAAIHPCLTSISSSWPLNQCHHALLRVKCEVLLCWVGAGNLGLHTSGSPAPEAGSGGKAGAVQSAGRAAAVLRAGTPVRAEHAGRPGLCRPHLQRVYAAAPCWDPPTSPRLPPGGHRQPCMPALHSRAHPH